MISPPVARVEVARRLVGEHDARVDRQRPCDRDALLLAAGHVRRQVVGALGEPHLAEHLQRLLAPAADRRELDLDVLDRRQRRDQVELLEDEAERAEPQRRELAVRKLARSRPSKKDVPALGRSSAPSSCSSVVLPEPLGPSSARNSPASISRSIPSSARTVVEPRWKNFATLVQLVLGRHQSTCLNASAGRSRAARMAPAVPAIRPPRRASPNPVARTVTPTGALSDTELVAVRAVDDAEAEERRVAGRRARAQRRAERVHRER